ncbi:hypothetical protein GALL_404850 [mine drainage metagenome]|uniref:DUF1640 domain-containing protein n=1 Tax=mine drainage metagenome TaxID=410659 RepID=A0A1J5QD21_9ZZZZ
MSAPCFDTLAFAKRLKAAGVEQAHAEAEAEALGEVVDHHFEALATKDDLRHLATKDDLRNFVTKDDLRNFATKDDLRNFATKDDLRNFATKDDLRNFVTKDEFHAEIGKLDRRLDALDNRFGKFEGDLAALKALMSTSQTQLEQRLLIKFGAMLSAAIVLLAALVKLGV